jgi:alpha-1,6-mannosyltransferase
MSAPQAPPSLERHHTLGHVPLRVTGAIGLLGSLCVLIGVAQSGSPFASKLPGAWVFGLGNGASRAGKDGVFLGIIVVYLGVVLMIIAWFELVRTLRRDQATPTRQVVGILAVWAIPVLVMPPLFSRDVYSYAAQGEMVSRGLNPYVLGPTALGRDPYLHLVDPIWRTAHAPYGPAWERLAGLIVQLARHNVAASIIGFRFVALVGMGLMAWGVFTLARSVGRDPAAALGFAVLNPLVLLVLLGGAHNDALMLGLLIAGCAAARRNHVVIGLLLCSLAAEVKVPALLGALVIGWWWSEGAASWRQRVPRVAGAMLIALALMAVIGLISGLGWRWVDGLSDPGVVVSWADPATAVGLLLSHLSHALGFGRHTAAYVQATRAAGLALAAIISIGLVLRSARIGAIQALGWSLLISVALGPLIWPWYETWGFVSLAVIAEGWTLRLLLALSAIACFADLPSVHFYDTTNRILPIASWTVLVGIIVAYGAVRLVPSMPRYLKPSSTFLTRWRVHMRSDRESAERLRP